MMKTYWKRLRAHPGVPIAAAGTFFFPLAGLGNSDWIAGVIAGSAASAAVWAIVLWTARTQPMREDVGAQEQGGSDGNQN
ncbi:hypothetical protein ACTPOE_16920 [Castellaniella sp. WN]